MRINIDMNENGVSIGYATKTTFTNNSTGEVITQYGDEHRVAVSGLYSKDTEEFEVAVKSALSELSMDADVVQAITRQAAQVAASTIAAQVPTE